MGNYLKRACFQCKCVQLQLENQTAVLKVLSLPLTNLKSPSKGLKDGIPKLKVPFPGKFVC